MSGTGRQWIRQGSLTVASPAQSADATSQPALDLSELKYTFYIRQQDAGSPNTAVFRIYNLKDATRKQIQQEFTRVVLQVGYQGSQPGIVFDGTIKQTRAGKERNTDTYLDLLATEGDLPYNFAIINRTLAPGATRQQQLDAIGQAIAPYGASMDTSAFQSTGGILPRGKVLFGMALANLDTVGQSTGYTWALVNGKITLIPLTGYLPNEAVVLNSQTGLIGQPESTQDGVRATCLINPKIRVGSRVQINNALINQTVVRGAIVPSYDNPFAGAYASTDADGIYRVVVQEYEGDSRGNPWYANLTCLAIDPSSPPASSVQEFP